MSQLFDKFTEPVTQIAKHVPTPDEHRYHATKADEILSVLQATSGWIGSSTLTEITHRFSACIHTLRGRGHVIENRKPYVGEFEWRYVGRIDVMPTEDGWQNAYYESDNWKAKRRKRLEHDGWRCVNCHATSDLQVHHWKYDLFDERLGDLMTFCVDCHQRIHATVTIAFPKSVTREIYERLPGFKVA